jgi:hypothetical protein
MARGRRPCRAVAGLGLEAESGSRSGTTPTGRPRLSASERRGGESWREGGLLGRGIEVRSWLGRAVREEAKGEERPAGLGCIEEKEKERKKMGQAKRRKREREKRNAFKCI